MKTLFLKELRENRRWAMLMGVGLLLLMAYAISSRMRGYNAAVTEALGPDCVLGVCGAGAILGLLQVFQDRRGGRWQFVAHRPVTAGRVFGAKVMAGLVLYVAMTVIPLAIVMAWVATPGHIPQPFEWRLIFPRLADVACGVIWYMAGLCAAARSGRVIGGRWAPLGFALAATAGTFQVELFSTAMLIVAAALALVTPAAWLASVNWREYESQGVGARIVQGVVMWVGIALACAWAFSTAGDMMGVMAPMSVQQRASYDMLKDGRVVRQESAGGRRWATDLNGRAVDLSDMGDDPYVGMGSIGFNAEDRRVQDDSARPLRSDASQVVSLGALNGDAWWYVAARRTLESFDTDTRRYSGSLGPEGYVAAPGRAGAFAMGVTFDQFVVEAAFGETMGSTPRSVYLIDVSHHWIKRIFTASEKDPVWGCVSFSRAGQVSNAIADSDHAIVTATTIHILGPDGVEVASAPLDQEWVKYAARGADSAMVDMGQVADGRYVVWYQLWYDADGSRAARIVASVRWLDAGGKTVARVDPPPLEFPRTREAVWVTGVNLLGLPPLAAVLPGERWDSGPVDARTIGFAVFFGVAATGVTIWLARRYAMRGREIGMWAGLNFLLGLTGILLLLAVRSLPGRGRCGNCGRWRVVSRERCGHCGSGFEAPPSEGIEIIESFEAAEVGG